MALPWFYITLLHSTVVLLHSTSLYLTLNIAIYIYTLHSTSVYHGSTWFYFALLWLYLTLLHSTMAPLHSKMALYMTQPWFYFQIHHDFTSLYIPWLYWTLFFTLQWLYLTLQCMGLYESAALSHGPTSLCHDSTSLYHGSTWPFFFTLPWLYLTLLHSAMTLLHNTTTLLYHGSTYSCQLSHGVSGEANSRSSNDRGTVLQVAVWILHGKLTQVIARGSKVCL